MYLAFRGARLLMFSMMNYAAPVWVAAFFVWNVIDDASTPWATLRDRRRAVSRWSVTRWVARRWHLDTRSSSHLASAAIGTRQKASPALCLRTWRVDLSWDCKWSRKCARFLASATNSERRAGSPTRALTFAPRYSSKGASKQKMLTFSHKTEIFRQVERT